MLPEDTLARARRLEPAALAQIHDQYFTEIYRYVRYRLDDEQACEDIAGEVFLRMLDALHKKRGPEQNIRGWLYGTANNMVNDYFRTRYARKVEELEKHDQLSDGHLPEHIIENAWQKEQVRRAVQELTHEQQHVLALRFSEERSLDETARVMGKSVTAVKALQFRALASLRRILEQKVKD